MTASGRAVARRGLTNVGTRLGSGPSVVFRAAVPVGPARCALGTGLTAKLCSIEAILQSCPAVAVQLQSSA